MSDNGESPRVRRSHRRVHAAVDAVLDVAAQKHANSLLEIVHAVGEARGRTVTVAVDDLAPGGGDSAASTTITTRSSSHARCRARPAPWRTSWGTSCSVTPVPRPTTRRSPPTTT